MTPHEPEDPEGTTFDVVVVGTGMGGSTLGHALAKRGRRVLFLERGRFLFGGADRGDGRLPPSPDESPDARLGRGWWPFPIEGRKNEDALEFFAPVGCGSGGTTGLYAAQLERLSPIDFKPRAAHPDAEGSTLPDAWPITYDDLLPYYRLAESLFRVRGTPDPLHPDEEVEHIPPPPLSPRDQHLYDSFRELGLHPYRPHVGYEFLPGCFECGGTLCPRACKNDAGRICLLPSIEAHGARLLSECEVTRIDADASSVKSVRCTWKGRPITVRGRIVVLAAGAYWSPILLLNSATEEWPDGLANLSGAVGRNLMVHAGDFIAVRPAERLSKEGPRKAIALNDLYVSEGRKLGTFQSVGVAVEPGYVLYFLQSSLAKSPFWMRAIASPFLRIAAHAAAFHFKDAAMFASIVEDLPYWENRVVPDSTKRSGMRFHYRYPDELFARNRLFRERISAALAPRHRTMVLTRSGTLNFGHVCGTCRFGDDPATSVLDRNNRAHGIENLYVVDASFFPSSGGTNPTLTIAANALRVANVIDVQLGSAV